MKHDTLPPSCLRVLGAVLTLAEEGGPITYREILRHLGLSGPNAIVPNLRRLRTAGLIDFVDGEKATIVPTCYVRFFPEALRRYYKGVA